MSEIGYETSRFNLDAAVSTHLSSLKVTRDSEDWGLLIDGTHCPLGEVQTVWFRRYMDPVLPSSGIHPADTRRLELESVQYARALCSALCRDARWVNPFRTAMDAESKLRQLCIARQVGLDIPRTLMGNNPVDIRTFVSENDSVYKAFWPGWFMDDSTRREIFTAPVRVEQLPADHLLAVAPGIYQEKIKKACEYRVVLIGQRAYSLRIDASNHPIGRLDWRAAPKAALKVSVGDVPEVVLTRCRELFSHLGLVFGCIDFILDDAGRFVFLEVNQGGQFLWMEVLCPDLRLLDGIVSFLSGAEVAKFPLKQVRNDLYGKHAGDHDKYWRRMNDDEL